jgi:hypothetical protein
MIIIITRWAILRCCRWLDYTVSSGRKINEWWTGEDSEWIFRGVIALLSLHLPGGGEERRENTSVRTPGVPTEIRN